MLRIARLLSRNPTADSFLRNPWFNGAVTSFHFWGGGTLFNKVGRSIEFVCNTFFLGNLYPHFLQETFLTFNAFVFHVVKDGNQPFGQVKGKSSKLSCSHDVPNEHPMRPAFWKESCDV